VAPDPVAAFGRAALAMLGKRDASEGLEEVARLRAVALDAEQAMAQVKADRDALEGAERSKLVAELVQLGAETPHTSGLANKQIAKRLADEPIGELRARVAALRGGRVSRIVPPAGADAGDLTAAEIAKCKARGIDPAMYAAQRQAIRERSRSAVKEQ
jgi:hypothetical protein